MYVATIEVCHTSQEPIPGSRGMDRTKRDVGRVTVRSESAEGLRRKMQMGCDTILYDEKESESLE